MHATSSAWQGWMVAIWWTEIGRSLSCPAPLAFHHPHTFMFTQTLRVEKKTPNVLLWRFTQRRDAPFAASFIRKLGSPPQPSSQIKINEANSKSTQTRNYVDTSVVTNRLHPTAPMQSGAQQIASNCTFWGFTILTSCVSTAGLHAGISLSERAPTRPSCYDPPSCGQRSSSPPQPPDVSRAAILRLH